MNATAARHGKFRTVVQVTSGNFLEMFDFFLFGIYASYIAKAFFPNASPFVSLMSAFLSFAAGFAMRPIGALVLGGYIDRIGRRKGLIVTLGIMASGTVLIAFVPSYATIGLAAPLLVVAGRLLQGFSAGVELGGVSVYLSEMATPGHKGFYVSWQSASQQVAIVVAALIGFSVNKLMAPDEPVVLTNAKTRPLLAAGSRLIQSLVPGHLALEGKAKAAADAALQSQIYERLAAPKPKSADDAAHDKSPAYDRGGLDRLIETNGSR